jgi:hypothetical protein
MLLEGVDQSISTIAVPLGSSDGHKLDELTAGKLIMVNLEGDSLEQNVESSQLVSDGADHVL